MDENNNFKIPESISKLLEAGEMFKNVSKYAMQIPQPNLMSTNRGIDEIQKRLQKANQEKYQREIENNEYLKSLVEHNEDISNYNRELVDLNRKILNKINSLDDTLLFLNEAFTNKSEIDKEQGQSYNSLLLELITIIDSKDGGKLKQFTNGLAAPVIAGLIVEYLKLKLGLSK